MKKLFKYALAMFMVLSSLCGCIKIEIVDGSNPTPDPKEEILIEESGYYTSKDDVALYIVTYEHLPDNYITKKEAKKLGWDSSKGNLWDVADGMSIGGDYFGNNEGLLPDDTKYHECDIDYNGGKRNSKRIVYGDDGSVYYTADHYKTFEELY